MRMLYGARSGYLHTFERLIVIRYKQLSRVGRPRLT